MFVVSKGPVADTNVMYMRSHNYGAVYAQLKLDLGLGKNKIPKKESKYTCPSALETLLVAVPYQHYG